MSKLLEKPEYVDPLSVKNVENVPEYTDPFMVGFWIF